MTWTDTLKANIQLFQTNSTCCMMYVLYIKQQQSNLLTAKKMLFQMCQQQPIEKKNTHTHIQRNASQRRTAILIKKVIRIAPLVLLLECIASNLKTPLYNSPLPLPSALSPLLYTPNGSHSLRVEQHPAASKSVESGRIWGTLSTSVLYYYNKNWRSWAEDKGMVANGTTNSNKK